MADIRETYTFEVQGEQSLVRLAGHVDTVGKKSKEAKHLTDQFVRAAAGTQVATGNVFERMAQSLDKMASELKQAEGGFSFFFKSFSQGWIGAFGSHVFDKWKLNLKQMVVDVAQMGRNLIAQFKGIGTQAGAALGGLGGLFKGGGGGGGGGAGGFAAGFAAGPIIAFGAAVAGVTAGIGLLVAGFVGAVAAVKSLVGLMTGAVSSLTQYASSTSDLAAKTGLSTDAVQQFGFAAKLTGTDVNAVAAGMRNMQVRLVEGDSAFRRMGLSIRELKQLSPDQQFVRVAEAIRNIRDPAQQAAAAMAVFGKQGVELLPAIKAGFTDIASEARQLGIVISKDVIQAADRLGDDMDKISTAWAAVKMNFAAGAVGSGGPLATMLKAVGDLNKLVVQHRAAIATFFQAIATAARNAVAVVGTLVSGMRQLVRFLPAGARSLIAQAGAGSGLSGGAKHVDAQGRPLAADLAHLAVGGGGTFTGDADLKRQEAAAKKLTEAYRDWFKVLRDINDEFEEMHREMQFSNQFNLTGVAKLPGVPLTAKEQKAALEAARGAGISVSERDMQTALARQAALDAGATKERQNQVRFAAFTKETNDSLKLGDKLARGMAKAVNLVADAFQLMGVKADSTLGKVGAVFGGAGAGMAAGASIGSMFGPGGTGIGAVIGGALGGVAALFGLGAADKQRREEERKKAEEERKRIQQAARQSRDQGIEGIGTHAPAFFANRTILTEADAKRQGVLFAAAWGAVVKEKGIVAAAELFGETFAKMGRDMAAAGIEPPAWFKQIQSSFLMGDGVERVVRKFQKRDEAGNLVFNEDGTPKMVKQTEAQSGLDEAFKQIATAAFEAAQFLTSLAQAGGVTEESFRAFEDEARNTFAAGKGRAIELGRTEEDAIKAGFGATNPLLKALLNESVVSGRVLSDDIQAMIAAQGIVPDVEFQKLAELRAIREAIGGLAPSWGGTGAPAPEAPPPPPNGSPEPWQAASGLKPMILPDMGGGRGPLIQTHAGEAAMIIPRHLVKPGMFKTASTPFFFQAAAGFGKRGPNEREPPGTHGGGGGLGGASTTSDSGSTGTSTTQAAQAAAAAEETRSSVSRLERVVEKLAEAPSAEITLAPTLNVNLDPSKTLQGQSDLVRQLKHAVEEALFNGEAGITAAVHHAMRNRKG